MNSLGYDFREPSVLLTAEPRLQYAIIPVDLISDADLTVYDRCVYAALDSFRNGQTGYCCPSTNTIARRAGVSRRQTIRALENLERREWVIRTYRHRQPTIYILPWREALDKATKRPRLSAHQARLSAHQALKEGFRVPDRHSNHLNQRNQTKRTIALARGGGEAEQMSPEWEACIEAIREKVRLNAGGPS